MFPSNETLNIDSDIEIGNAMVISFLAFIIFCGKSEKHPRAHLPAKGLGSENWGSAVIGPGTFVDLFGATQDCWV